MQVNWNWLYQYSGKGQSFVNLNDYSDVLDLTQFPSNALDACTVANSLQAVPVAMAGRIYYWNMATFKKAGLDHYPTTEQELLDAVRQTIRQELRGMQLTKEEAQDSGRAGDVDESVLGFLLALQEGDEMT